MFEHETAWNRYDQLLTVERLRFDASKPGVKLPLRYIVFEYFNTLIPQFFQRFRHRRKVLSYCFTLLAHFSFFGPIEFGDAKLRPFFRLTKSENKDRKNGIYRKGIYFKDLHICKPQSTFFFWTYN